MEQAFAESESKFTPFAGEAVPCPAQPWTASWAREKTNKFFSSPLGIFVGLTLFVHAAGFTAASLLEAQKSDTVPLAQAESQYMQDQGYSPARPLGELLPLTHAAEAAAGALFGLAESGIGTHRWFATRVPLLGKYPAYGLVSRLFIPDTCAVNVGSNDKPTYFGDPDTAKRSFRHEDSHCRLMEQPSLANLQFSVLQAGSPEARLIQAAVSAEHDPEISKAYKAIAKSHPQSKTFWRAEYAGELYSELFSDARALLTASRKADGQMKAEALRLHAWRSVGTSMETGSSLLAAGNDHATDPASFIIAQLPQAPVASLSSSELDALASRIASDALAWTLLRQPANARLFDSASPEWIAAAQAAGMQNAEAEEALLRLRELSSSANPPAAAAGPFLYSIAGRAYQAEGTQLMNYWKFDGLGGYTLIPREKLQAQAQTANDAQAPASANLDDKSMNKTATLAIASALAEHAALLRISGSPSDEQSRCELTGPHDMFGELVQAVCQQLDPKALAAAPPSPQKIKR